MRRADAQEIEVSLDEVRQLGEQDADFRRSIVTSSETLNTIVDASIRELDKLREGTGEKRLKLLLLLLIMNTAGKLLRHIMLEGGVLIMCIPLKKAMLIKGNGSFRKS